MKGAEVKAVAADASSLDATAHAREVSQVIQAAMQTLAQEHREALVLRDVEGLSAEKAAAVVGIEVGALKSRLHRARMQLKQSLAAVLDDQDTNLGCSLKRAAERRSCSLRFSR